MKDDSNFEASVKSGITPDVAFIKENDEIIQRVTVKSKNSPMTAILLLAAAVIFFFMNKIIAAVLAVAGIAAIILYIRKRSMKSGVGSDEFMREVYEEGLLVPGIIINTNPLTVMAMANITAHEGCPERHACYVLEVAHLPGMKGELYEKVPCSCMFCYEGGNYHSAFQPHPLCWGTQNQSEIKAAIDQLDNNQREDNIDEWEIIKKLSLQYPDLQPDYMLLTDENYMPLGEKHYTYSNYEPVVTDKVREQYRKNTPEISYITDDIPAAELYNKMIDISLKHQVYEYISTHCKDEDFSPLTNPGFFTYVSDPVEFLEALNRRNITLENGEYPLIAGFMLITNKGCWKKKEFYPWSQFKMEAHLTSDGEIAVKVDGKDFAEFKCNTQYYQNKETFGEEDMAYIRKLELDGMKRFLADLETLCM